MAKAASDPNALATIIRRTNFSVDGATAIEAKESIESNFNDLRQGPTQNSVVFKKEFDTQVRALENSGGQPIDPEQLALTFLGTALPGSRRHPFCTNMSNTSAYLY